MADLVEILESGDITKIDIDGLDVKPAIEAIDAKLDDGILIPSLSAIAAQNGAIFFNTDTAQLSWKSPAGILLRFRMQVV